MLSLFAGCGRANYDKCARLYHQSINEVPEKHIWLYQCFDGKCYYLVRRSIRYGVDSRLTL